MVQQNAARVIKIVETSKQQHLSSHSKETKVKPVRYCFFLCVLRMRCPQLQKAVCSTEKLSRLRISLLTQYGGWFTAVDGKAYAQSNLMPICLFSGSRKRY